MAAAAPELLPKFLRLYIRTGSATPPLHERVEYDAASCAFQSRDEVEHFYRLNSCRERLREGEAAAVVFEAAVVPAGVNEWLAARFGGLHVRIGQMLQREGDNEGALAAYRAFGCIGGSHPDDPAAGAAGPARGIADRGGDGTSPALLGGRACGAEAHSAANTSPAR